MSVELLDKTRKINRLLHNNSGSKMAFCDICSTLSEVLASQVLLISKKGKVLGQGECSNVIRLYDLEVAEKGSHIDLVLNERLLSILSTKENLDLYMLGMKDKCIEEYQGIVTPINIAGERLGTLLMYREKDKYRVDDVILGEYATAVIGLEMVRALNDENSSEVRKERVVKSAINTLSYSEKTAILCIFEELEEMEGVLVASKIADRIGITRSVIVNALRKFESAGIIESKSSGMKGTYIRITNDRIFDELEYLRVCLENSKKNK